MQLGLDVHVQKFVADQIDGSTLELAKDTELEELGMNADERQPLLAEIKRRRKVCTELPAEQWVEVLGQSVGKDIPWDQLQSTLAPAGDNGMIDFQEFVDGYAVKTLSGLDVADLYRNYEYLDLVFTQFDQSKEGYISQDE